MRPLFISVKFGVFGIITGLLAFAFLFLGLSAIGGGHGSVAIWYTGLAFAAVSGLLLLACGFHAALKKSERKTLLPCIAMVIMFSFLWLNFFAVAEWLADFLGR